MFQQLRQLIPLVVIVAVVLGGMQLLQGWQSRGQGDALRAAAQPGDILMVSSTTCNYCTQARIWMTDQRVPFTECFIEQDAACAATFQRLGGRGTPTLLVRGQVIVGFDRARLLTVLSRS
ncbi:MAG: glutaredoxin family protein [Microbacteriaceae bacterium]|nr:glutaredoxin family protein [Burkholderiaceae bacterium]